MIRLNTSTPPTAARQQDAPRSPGGPERRVPERPALGDDVLDIELRALAGGTPFTADFNRAPNNALTDGVDANDVPFLAQFPYVAPPHQGYEAD